MAQCNEGDVHSESSTAVYLDVIVRVPVGVVDDDGVGGGQVDAQAPGPGGQQEGKLGGAGSCGRNHTHRHQVK